MLKRFLGPFKSTAIVARVNGGNISSSNKFLEVAKKFAVTNNFLMTYAYLQTVHILQDCSCFEHKKGKGETIDFTMATYSCENLSVVMYT